MNPAPAAVVQQEPRPSLSVVVPVYNSERSLRPLVARLGAVLARVARDFEVILVNDGSADASWGVIEELVGLHPWVTGIDLERNYGQQNATLCGIRHARGEVVVTMDDDLEHPPEAIPLLLLRLDQGFDVVYGTGRPVGRGWWRRVGRRVMRPVLQRVVGREEVRDASALRALRTRLRDTFSEFAEPRVCLDVLLTRGTSRFSSVAVEQTARHSGVSNYGLGALVAQSAGTLVQLSALPLRVAAIAGSLSALLGAGAVAYLPGRGPLLAALLAPVQVSSLAVFGMYAAQARSRRLGRPPYRVRRLTGSQARPEGASAARPANLAG